MDSEFFSEEKRPVQPCDGDGLQAQRRFFEEELRLPLALEEESGKLFPASNRARDVRDRLLEHAGACGAEVRLGSILTGLAAADGGWRLELEGGAALRARLVVLATGGLSVPTTGSDGTGLRLAERLGHVMHPTYPALTPLTTTSARWTALSGVSLEARLTAPPETPGYNRTQQELAHQFFKDWTGPTFPRFLLIQIQHANPYYDDSYAVNSANLGPYGDPINEQLIPHIERTFRGLGQGWARFMYGGSTGG